MIVFVVIFVLAIAFTVALPAISGIGSFKIDKTKLKRKEDSDLVDSAKREKKQNDNNTGAYLPPDEFDDLDQDEDTEKMSKREALKAKLDQVNIPISFKTSAIDTQNSSASLRNRGGKNSDSNKDPNEFDYNIDEIISEENEKDKLEYQQRIKKIVGGRSPANDLMG